MVAWFRDAELGVDELGVEEQLLFRRAAIRRQGWRSVGGEVSVTDRRVIFVPNRLESLLRAPVVSLPRDAVTGAAVVRPTRRRRSLSGVLPGRQGQAEVVTADLRWVVRLAEPEALVALLVPART